MQVTIAMLKATRGFETDRASRYVQAMFKHFAHKVKVSYDTERGTAAMPYGKLDMFVRDGVLHFEIEAESEDLLERMKYVVDAHIVRFAFREKLTGLAWSAA